MLQGVVTLAQNKPSNVAYVDPTIGGVGLLLEPTRPTVHLPNSMVRVFPSRKDQLDPRISYYPLTIASHRQQSLFGVMPYSGPITEGSWKERLAYDAEITTPYYYSVRLEERGDSIEFTPTARSGHYVFHFKENAPHAIRLNILNGGSLKSEGANAVSGIENFSGMKAYFYAEISRVVKNVQYPNERDQKAAFLHLGNEAGPVHFRYGISFISVENAKGKPGKRNRQNRFQQNQRSSFQGLG